MNQNLQNIWNLIDQLELLPAEQKNELIESIKKADKEIEIISFKLDRTEKVKRTTAILLDETIEELEQKRKAVEESHEALKKSMEELKATQAQLVHAEKMASLGELTAGIAHEIQNPLNFVNNFAELNSELIEELKEEIQNQDWDEVQAIATDIASNEEKIKHHGKRADGIVKGMLQHSRTSGSEKEPTNINALADEYLRLAYHGLRAKDQSFHADFTTVLDDSLPPLRIVPQDIGRVLLNLIHNAFYAVKDLSGLKDPTGLVTISTKNTGDNAEIRVQDNGPGIPQDILTKIFQPFFTTKPTGEGTGLGLSLAYDIITKGHGGELNVETSEQGTCFIFRLPIK